MKIAVAGLHIECSSYNPARSHAEDFITLRGREITQSPQFSVLSEFDAELLPAFYARAVPGAPIAMETYQAFKAEILQRLGALMPFDGLYLPLHGASHVAGMEDSEGDLVTAIRDLVGPDMPISASFDLHGNLSQRIIDSIDMFTAYRTAPHIDVEDTHRRGMRQLMRCLTTGERPGVVWAKIPVSLPGERTSTEAAPADGLYAALEQHEAPEGIWDAGLMVGYVWVDEPRVTAAAVVTGTDRPAMEQAARDIAQSYWDAREDFDFGTETGETRALIAKAMGDVPRPVVLADSGDNPTAGGAGDRAGVLAALIAAGAQRAVLAGIADRPATEAAFAAGVGAEITLPIGGTIDTGGSERIEVTAEVLRLITDGDAPAQNEAVFRAGGITFVTSARRRPYHHFSDFARLGIDLAEFDIVVVKSGYLSPDMKAHAAISLMALSPGIVDQYVERLPRSRTPVPTFPFQRDFDYAPEPQWSARAGTT
ncbi:M81 family metallopeptidase [Pseudoroseicyclus sp. H15]